MCTQFGFYVFYGFRACLNIDSLNFVLILQTNALTWFPMFDPFIPFIWWGEASVYEFHTGQLKYLTDDLTTIHDGEVKQFELRGHLDGGSCGKRNWWRHHTETFFPLLAFCVGNLPVPGEFLTQRPVMRSFGVFFDLRLNQQLSKQWRRRWFETPSHYDITVMMHFWNR